MILFTRVLLTTLVMISGVSVSAMADDFPSKPIRMILPIGAGGGSDIIARAIGKRLEEKWRHPVIVENIPAAGGIVGVRELVKAPPDGHTIGWASSTYMVQHRLNKEANYKWPDSFELLHRGTTAITTILVSSRVPATTLQELVDYAKANPGKLKAANSGFNTQSHISSVRFQSLAGVKFVDVPYTTPPMMTQALMSGEVDVSLTIPSVAESGLQTGQIRMLAVAQRERTPLLPAVPTMQESGVNMVYSLWQGFILPKGTPEPIIEKLHAAFSEAIQAPEVKHLIDSQTLTVETGTRKEMIEKINREVMEFDEIMKSLPSTP